MAYKKFKILFAIDGLLKSIKNSEKLKKTLQFPEILQRRFTNEIERTNKKLKKTVKLTDEQKSSLENILSNTPLELITSFDRKIISLNKSFKGVGGTSNFFNVLNSRILEGSKNAKKLLFNIKGIFNGGVLKFIGSMTKSIGLMSGQFIALAAAAAPFLSVIAAIVAAIIVLKRIWELNIGGIQTKFFKAFAEIQKIWVKFSVNFDKTLRKLSPLINALLVPPFKILMFVIKTVGVLLNSLFIIMQPIIDALGEIGKVVSESFVIFHKKTGKGIDLFKIFSKVIITFAKIIALGIKAGIMPILIIIRLLSKLNLFIVKLISLASRLKIVKTIFKSIKNAIKGVVDLIKVLLKPFLLIVNAATKVGNLFSGKAGKSAKDIISGSPVSTQQTITNLNKQRSNTTNNNANIVINASGDISQKNAPRIADIISSQLGLKNKVV